MITIIRRQADWLLLLLLACLLLPLRAALSVAAGLELHFDEAQYWDWSRHLDWSYYSKGPLVAWLIAFSEWLFGHGEWQVRLFAWMSYGVFLAALFYLARDIWQQRAAGWWAVTLGLTTPVYFALGGVMTTDIFMLTTWVIALNFALRALYREQPNAWFGFGVAIGIGGLTKLSVGLLPFFLGFFLLFTPRGRAALQTYQFWLGLMILFAVMSPVWWWNAHNNWVMLRHELGHVGVTDAPDTYNILQGFSEFLAGQWLMLSPVVAVIGLMSVWRLPKQSEQRFIWLMSLFSLVFFVVKALHGKVQPNWPAPAYLGFLVLFAGVLPKLGQKRRKILYVGILLGIVAMLLAFFLPRPLHKMKVWRAPVAQLASQGEPVDFLLAEQYHLAAELAFYWPRPITVYLTGAQHRRANQYDIWPSVNQEARRDGLYVQSHARLPDAVNQAFGHCQALAPIEARLGKRALRTLYGWRCVDFRPQQWAEPERY